MFTFKNTISSVFVLTTILSTSNAFAGYIDFWRNDQEEQEEVNKKRVRTEPTAEEIQHALRVSKEIQAVDDWQDEIIANAIELNIPLVMKKD